VSWHLGRAAFIDLWTVVLGLASLIALVRFRMNSAWLIALGAVFGWLVR
jgi:chromate transporter